MLIPCAQDEVVEVAFALSHHEAVKIAETPATALAALARQGRGEVRVSTLTPQERKELVKAKQAEISSFLKHAGGGSGYEVWNTLQQLDANALGHNEETRRLAEGSLGGTGVY